MEIINIKTERVLIRNLVKSDAEDYFQIFGNPVIAKYDDFSPITREEADENINDIIIAYCNNGHEKEFGVELQAENKIIGVLYLKEEDSYFSTGYHFNEEYHGKGFATEAVKAFIDYLEKNYSKEIRAIVDPLNERSIELLKKLSFIFLEEKKTKKEDNTIMIEYIYKKCMYAGN
ncbi:MAG: GNAT family N-acetyltransferase [Spirochaetaceae bacterium]|nr:GNAT family N-acetyltransferase [Spirochaetaceae bacterium]MCL2704604.1 GNAT family N-acetyltransferase [Spirochaetaceae bacterium]